MERSVLHLGKKDNENDVDELLSNADIGITPFDSNPLSKKSIQPKSRENIACGLAVFTTIDHNSIIGELIDVNYVGVLSQLENFVDLAKAMEQLYNICIRVQNASKRAVLLVHKQFYRSKFAEEYYQIVK